MNIKLHLSLAILFLSITAHAQMIEHYPLIRLQQTSGDRHLPSIDLAEKSLITGRMPIAGKGAGAHKRTYNYVDHMALNNRDVRSSPDYVNIPYMWYNPDIYAIYDGGIKDTIRLASYGMVFQPYWTDYNNNPFSTPGIMIVEPTDNYTVDSIIVYGVYRRNALKPAVVDTLMISYTYGLGVGTNIPDFFYPDIAPRYGVDTLISAVLHYDSLRHVIKRPNPSSGPVIAFERILLHAADTAFSAFSIAPAITIPAGNLFGVSVTFRSGETYIPYSDTAFVSMAINPFNPYKYGMFRPAIYKERPSGFPIYVKHNYNSGQFVQLPEYPATPVEYTPTWLWTANGGASNNQFPDIDFVVSCPTCKSLDVPGPPSLITGKPFPNPSDRMLTIPLIDNTINEVSIMVTNTLGQEIYRQQQKTNNKNVNIETAQWRSGVYFISVLANGHSTTSRVLIAH